MPLLNEADVDNGPITSNALNLTRVAALVSALVAFVVGLDGTITSAISPVTQPAVPEDSVILGFDQGQRLVLLVALVALLAVVYSADLISRAISASSQMKADAQKSANLGIASVLIFPTSRLARLKGTTADGKAIGIRASDNMILFDDPATSTVHWVAESDLDFRTP